MSILSFFTSNPCLPRFICGEIQRDVNHLLATAKELQFGDALSQVKDSILTAMEDGKLKKVPIHIVFLTVYSLLSYPFLAKNLIVSLFLEDEAALLTSCKNGNKTSSTNCRTYCVMRNSIDTI